MCVCVCVCELVKACTNTHGMQYHVSCQSMSVGGTCGRQTAITQKTVSTTCYRTAQTSVGEVSWSHSHCYDNPDRLRPRERVVPGPNFTSAIFARQHQPVCAHMKTDVSTSRTPLASLVKLVGLHCPEEVSEPGHVPNGG